MKVQASIQENQVRVTRQEQGRPPGRDRSCVRGQDFGIELQFVNLRDSTTSKPVPHMLTPRAARRRPRLAASSARDGIRGVANEHPMTPELALQLGRAVTFVAGRGKSHAPRVVLGKDTRLSGYMLEQAIASGVCAMGGRVLLCGPMPTPAIANLTVSMRADAGIVISASHNPYQDNGIKVFGADGFKLPDDAECEIETFIADDTLLGKRSTGPGIGRAEKLEDARGRYVVFLKQTFPRDLSLEGVRVVVDAAHGAAYRVAPLVLQELGAIVTAIGVKPNGVNINRDAGAMHPDNVRAEVVKRGAALGIALDGDADRVILVDEKGQIVDGDQLLAMCGASMTRAETLNEAHRRRHGHVEPGSRARARRGRGQALAHAGRRSLRRRGHARGRLQPGRRAIGPHHLPRPCHHGRRHAGARCRSSR